MPYLRRTYRLPGLPAEAEDLLLAELWAAGTLGTESLEGGTLAAWFAGPVPVSLPPGVQLIAEEEVAGKDWLAAWRQTAQPFPLGRSFFVDPREPGAGEVSPPPGRTLLTLPARTAFGTGSHESTRLAVELLEDCGVAGRAVLDVGCGTGVLAFCALLLGARSAVALDLDPAAAVAAEQNAELNRAPLAGRRPLVLAGGVGALASPGPGRGRPAFELVLLNVIPEEILPSLGEVLARLALEGELIFSGILAEKAGAVLGELAGRGLFPVAEARAGEWVACRFAREGGR